jgi:hypothetical protein
MVISHYGTHSDGAFDCYIYLIRKSLQFSNVCLTFAIQETYAFRSSCSLLLLLGLVLFIGVFFIRIRRILMFLDLPDPHPDPLVTSTAPAPHQAKIVRKTLITVL